MKRRSYGFLRMNLLQFVAALLLILTTLQACNLPLTAPELATGDQVETPPALPTLEEATTDSSIFVITHAAITVPASLVLQPADLPFEMDCSGLDASRQPECDTYIANTRDITYPLARQLTGASLSACYEAVYYVIVPNEQLTDRQGQASDNHVTYNLRSTLDLNTAPLYDGHEILHVIAYCNGALDQHVFHGAFETQIDLTLTGASYQWPGRDYIVDWLETRLVPDLQQMGTGMETATPGPNEGIMGAELLDACAEIFGSLVTILYYDAGIETVQQLYRATITPGPEIVPNATLARIFGESLGRQFQVVVNGLKLNPVYQLDVPECGIE